jgi:hypothetical protein
VSTDGLVGKQAARRVSSNALPYRVSQLLEVMYRVDSFVPSDKIVASLQVPLMGNLLLYIKLEATTIKATCTVST